MLKPGDIIKFTEPVFGAWSLNYENQPIGDRTITARVLRVGVKTMTLEVLKVSGTRPQEVMHRPIVRKAAALTRRISNIMPFKSNQLNLLEGVL